MRERWWHHVAVHGMCRRSKHRGRRYHAVCVVHLSRRVVQRQEHPDGACLRRRFVGRGMSRWGGRRSRRCRAVRGVRLRRRVVQRQCHRDGALMRCRRVVALRRCRRRIDRVLLALGWRDFGGGALAVKPSVGGHEGFGKDGRSHLFPSWPAIRTNSARVYRRMTGSGRAERVRCPKKNVILNLGGQPRRQRLKLGRA